MPPETLIPPWPPPPPIDWIATAILSSPMPWTWMRSVASMGAPMLAVTSPALPPLPPKPPTPSAATRDLLSLDPLIEIWPVTLRPPWPPPPPIDWMTTPFDPPSRVR